MHVYMYLLIYVDAYICTDAQAFLMYMCICVQMHRCFLCIRAYMHICIYYVYAHTAHRFAYVCDYFMCVYVFVSMYLFT